MSAPFFSVIIPVYNRAPVLGAALASVLEQTCQDFEIVVVDDGSKDDPAAVIAAFADPRIRLIRQENKGGGAARNTAIEASVGRFIAPLDSDDLFLPHHLETMKAMLDGTTGLVGYARILVDRGEGRMFLKPPRALSEDEKIGEYLLCDRGFVPTITVVVERHMARQVRYHTDLRFAEDTDFAIRLKQAGCAFRMAPKAGAVWKDLHDPGRTSAAGQSYALRTLRFAGWLDQMKPLLTHRAWLGGRGWALAKMLARDGHKLTALRYYLIAVLAGCYRPRLAVVVLLQILLDARAYRTLADRAISWLHVGLRESEEKGQAAAVERT